MSTATAHPTNPTVSPHQAEACTTRRPRPWVYARIDTLNTLRRPDMLFFTLIMPLGMYLFWGAAQDYADYNAGHGNVAAATMINMSAFSVAMAATCTAAGAAVEQASGWGRQVALTAGGLRAYIITKLLTALIVSVFPVTVIFTAGAFTGARMDTPLIWAASYFLSLLVAVPFACCGLAVGMWVPAQAAVGIAGASISVFAFLGNLFMPLSGTLFTFARFTPLYGAGSLATRALQGDVVATTTGTVHEDLWLPVANILVWTSIFALTCLAARRHVTTRH
ncbi:Uncharacterised protein [Actinomyces bovis]|uniref:ABC-2 family transporter protein n=1 Tax=Actinomyces bovis TaxID=1658 RepID=A0ABY1VMG1_9ACTO|nr:ABC transporter [Actinomyces bovis]SPT52662.1 Uncharacterised protein [Actinomyces bovis]VEG54568.1 Uncharacterised protein [Actinomyces israelii]